MNVMHFLAWLVAGLLLAAPLLLYARHKSADDSQLIFGRGLVVASAIYVGFALIEARTAWVVIEFAGVIIFTAFYLLASKSSMNWLIAGWLTHPAWDGLVHLVGPGATVAPSWYAIACISFDWAIAIFLLSGLRTLHCSVLPNTPEAANRFRK
jgi:hypothetical protein